MKKPFEVGDRVAVYEGINKYRGPIDTVGNFQGADYIRIKDGKSISREFHPKQCRRLVKKERRRFFVQRDEVDRIITDLKEKSPEDWETYALDFSLRKLVDDDIEFIEVRRK